MSYQQVRVVANPTYLEDESEPDSHKYVWAYQVTIENRGMKFLTLTKRSWTITDVNGYVQEVEGEGVIGRCPTISPGEKFSYMSGALLQAPSGIMVGEYEFKSEIGERLFVSVPAFSLDSPYDTPCIQ